MPNRILEWVKRFFAVLSLNDIILLTLIVHRALYLYIRRELWKCQPPIQWWLIWHFALGVMLRSGHLICWISSAAPQFEGSLVFFGNRTQEVTSFLILFVGFPILMASTAVGFTWFLLLLGNKNGSCFPMEEHYLVSTPWLIGFTLIFSILWTFRYSLHFIIGFRMAPLFIQRIWNRDDTIISEDAIIIEANSGRLSTAAAKMIPKVALSSELRNVLQKRGSHNNTGAIVCTICLEEIKDGELSWILPCDHLFHMECGQRWFERSLRCPNCQVHLVDAINKQFIPYTERSYGTIVHP